VRGAWMGPSWAPSVGFRAPKYFLPLGLLMVLRKGKGKPVAVSRLHCYFVDFEITSQRR